MMGLQDEGKLWQVVQDLWGLGFTLVRRPTNPDPFWMDPATLPKDRAYQWFHLEHDKFHYEHGGWARVPYSRHEGVFAPWGTGGDIEVHGCGLFDKPKFEVDQEREANIARAKKLVTDWVEKTGEDGLSGHVKTCTSDEDVIATPVGDYSIAKRIIESKETAK